MARRPSPTGAALDGLFVVDKPIGWSSMDVVRRVRRAAGGAKTGHAGTLDPLATGVVICCLGRATRAVETLMGMTKVYETQMDLSAFTVTDDREGDRQPVAVDTAPDASALRRALDQFQGQIQQTPPAHSAVHVDGRRAYQLARRGQAVELSPRTVHIERIELLDYHWPMVGLRVVCGRGVYIRSLARDLGKALNTGGHLAALRRTAIGLYDLSMAADAARLEQPITPSDLLPVPPTG